MNFWTKTLLATILSLISIPAAADDLVSCLEVKKPKDMVFSYLIKSTKSQRLASDITFKSSAGQTVIISSLQVAQYVNSSFFSYILIDDPTESPVISFQALKPCRGKTFPGVIQEIDPATQKVVKRRQVKCSQTPL